MLRAPARLFRIIDLMCVSLRQRYSVSWEKRSRSLADYPVDDDRSDDDSLNGCALDLIPRFVVPFFFFAARDPVPVILSVPPALPVRVALMPVYFVTIGIDVPFVTTFAAWIVLRIRLPIGA